MLKAEQEILDIIKNSKIKPEVYLEGVKVDDFDEVYLEDIASFMYKLHNPIKTVVTRIAQYGNNADLISDEIIKRVDFSKIEFTKKSLPLPDKSSIKIAVKKLFKEIPIFNSKNIESNMQLGTTIREDIISKTATKIYNKIVEQSKETPINESAQDDAEDKVREALAAMKAKKINKRTILVEVFPGEDIGSFDMPSEMGGMNNLYDILDEMANGNPKKIIAMAQKIIDFVNKKPLGYKIKTKNEMPINESDESEIEKAAESSDVQKIMDTLDDVFTEALINCSNPGEQQEAVNMLYEAICDIVQGFLDEVGEMSGDVESVTEDAEYLIQNLGKKLSKATFGANVD